MDNPTNRNLTNGQIQLNIDEEDRLPAGQKFTTSWQLEDSQNEDIALAKTTTFLENIRTGEFSEIPDNYLIRNEEVKHFTSDTFASEMRDRAIMFSHMISKVVLFFEGLLAGMCLLQFIVLKMALTTYDKQVFRVDQIVRVTALTSTLGSIFVVISTFRTYTQGTKKSSASQLNQLRVQYIGAIFSCVFYCLCWVFVNISHQYVVVYNLSQIDVNQRWYTFQIIYMVFALIGWMSSVISSNYLLAAV